ncbi:MAG: hypothetical protein JSR82_24545 [Verrucomicrobia bacterium]|nr:hypothetical protein [Verrucomicrobiota bacterium]
MRFLLVPFAVAAVAGLAASARADVQINLTMADLRTSAGASLLANDRLIQFVNLGPNGVFDAVTPGSWVGGDDQLITLSFGSAEWGSAAGFDLQEFDPFNPGLNGVPGQLVRTFVFGSLLTEGTAIGVRWFPEYSTQDYYDGVLPLPASSYGQFTAGWTVPAQGQIADLIMLTVSEGGTEPDAAGFADFTTVPEADPRWVGALGVGAVLAWRWRGRRRTA